MRVRCCFLSFFHLDAIELHLTQYLDIIDWNFKCLEFQYESHISRNLYSTRPQQFRLIFYRESTDLVCVLLIFLRFVFLFTWNLNTHKYFVKMQPWMVFTQLYGHYSNNLLIQLSISLEQRAPSSARQCINLRIAALFSYWLFQLSLINEFVR